MAALALLASLCLLTSLRLLARTRAVPEQEIPVCPTRPGVPLNELMADASVLSCEVRIIEVVALDDEVMVGTTEGIFHMHLPWPFARQQALDRLHLWRMSATRLIAFHAPAHRLAVLADEDTGHFLCTPAPANA